MYIVQCLIKNYFGCRIFDVGLIRSNVKNPTFDRTRFGCRIFDIRLMTDRMSKILFSRTRFSQPGPPGSPCQGLLAFLKIFHYRFSKEIPCIQTFCRERQYKIKTRIIRNKLETAIINIIYFINDSCLV